MGRTLRNEYLRFRRLLSRTIARVHEAPVYLDRIDLNRPRADVAGRGSWTGIDTSRPAIGSA